MKHLELYEDFRTIKNIPKWFYLVLKIDTSWESLTKMEFNGVSGISDNPEIINSWFDVRDTLLIMNGEEFLKLNKNVHRIDYSNPNQLVSNNFYILNRLLHNKGNRFYYDVIQKIFSKSQLIKFRKDKYRNISDILNKNIYAYTNVLEEFVENGGNINNLWHFVNLVHKNLYSVIDKYNKSYTFSKPLIVNFDKDDLYYVIQECVLYLAKSWQKEGEWLIKPINGNKTFQVPINSKLYFKIDVKEEAELKRLIDANKYGSYRGMSDEKLKLVDDLKKYYNLDKNYDVEFIEGHLKTFDIWKDEPIPQAIPFKKLMKRKS